MKQPRNAFCLWTYFYFVLFSFQFKISFDPVLYVLKYMYSKFWNMQFCRLMMHKGALFSSKVKRKLLSNEEVYLLCELLYLFRCWWACWIFAVMSSHKAFHAERPPGSSHTWWCWLAQDCGSVLLWRWSSVHVKHLLFVTCIDMVHCSCDCPYSAYDLCAACHMIWQCIGVLMFNLTP